MDVAPVGYHGVTSICGIPLMQGGSGTDPTCKGKAHCTSILLGVFSNGQDEVCTKRSHLACDLEACTQLPDLSTPASKDSHWGGGTGTPVACGGGVLIP